MSPLQALRQAHRIGRLVLIWFALSLGVAIASPLVNPKGVELICSGAGVMKLVVKGADGSTSTTPSLDCPMCAGVVAPPPVLARTPVRAEPLAFALSRDQSAHLKAVTAARLAARAPPVLS